MVRALQHFFFRRMSSKKERIAELETIVAELKQENKELNDAINAILLDIRDLQQFKRFVELSRSSQHYVNVPTLAAAHSNTAKA
jgi:hypothetical protein